MPPTAPAWPQVAHDKGHYESYYVRAVSPERASAVWIRYTIHKEPRRAPAGALWCTLWQAGRPGPLAVKQAFRAPRPGDWIELGTDAAGGAFGPGLARGAVAALGHTAAWELRFGDGSGPYHHLPHPRLYGAPLPRTKTLSPVCDTTFDGWAEVDGRRVDVGGWRGMVGHNWGAEHAERWIWTHGIAFDETPDAWVDLVAGRIRVGRVTTPWIVNGVLHLDGRRRPLGGIPAVRATQVHETPREASITVPGARILLDAPSAQVVGWTYADPGGGEHSVAHCSVAAMEVHVDGRILRTEHGAAYELGMRERDHGVALQPFPDG